MPDSSTRLSVIVPTRQGWPSIKPMIETLADQVGRVGGELIVLDASGREPPSLGSHVQWLPQPTDMSVFQLRRVGYGIATAEIVAVTEDHCRVEPGWCDRIIALHAAHPDAVAIGGAVDNGSRSTDIDWAAYLVTQLPFAPTLADGPAERVTGPANLSFKRRAIDRFPVHEDFGTIELFDQAALLLPGESFWLDSELMVFHHQSLGFRGTSAIEFHNGRTLGGFRRRTMERRDWVRVVGMPFLIVYRIGRTLRMARHKRVPRAAVRSATWAVAWLHLCAGSGELLGYATGPGDSARRLR